MTQDLALQRGCCGRDMCDGKKLGELPRLALPQMRPLRGAVPADLGTSTGGPWLGQSGGGGSCRYYLKAAGQSAGLLQVTMGQGQLWVLADTHQSTSSLPAVCLAVISQLPSCVKSSKAPGDPQPTSQVRAQKRHQEENGVRPRSPLLGMHIRALPTVHISQMMPWSWAGFHV